MKSLYKFTADTIFLFHIAVFFIAVFGWIWTKYWYVYMGTLVAVIISDLFFGYCLISRWEFDLRKKINPRVNYDYNWSTFYTYKLTAHRLSSKFYSKVAVFFLVSSFVINIYFHFFYF